MGASYLKNGTLQKKTDFIFGISGVDLVQIAYLEKINKKIFCLYGKFILGKLT